MAIYQEFTNLDTGNVLVSIDEFALLETGTTIRRKNGKTYIKTSAGVWNLKDAPTLINNTGITDVYTKTQLLPLNNDGGHLDSGGTLDARYYTRNGLLPFDNDGGHLDSGGTLDVRYFTRNQLLPWNNDGGFADAGSVLDDRYYTKHQIDGYIATANSSDLTTSTTFDGDVTGTYNTISVKNDSHTHDIRYYTKTDSDNKFMIIHTHPYDNYVSWNAKDGDGTIYDVTSSDTLTFAEGTGMDVNFTADDVLTFTNTAPNVTTNLSTTYDASTVTVESSDGTNAVISGATITAAGAMTASDKSKLNAIAAGSDYYGYWTLKDSDGTSYTITSQDILQITEGTGIDVDFTGDDILTITNTAPNVTTNISINHGVSSVDVNSSDGADGTINAATTGSAGVMSANDKSKLNGIAEGANYYVLTKSGVEEVLTGGITSHSHAYIPLSGGTISGVIQPNSNGSLDLGTGSAYFRYIYGTAIKAQYADLAEKYESDKEYPVGTVVEVGGTKEITLFNGGALAGVISANPGLMLNESGNGQYVALKGKVPVLCEGTIFKGQYCIACEGGKVIGIFKEDIDSVDQLDIVGVALDDSTSGTVMVKI